MTTSPEAVADLILNAMPEAPRSADDAEYVPRFADLMRLVERAGMLPIACASSAFEFPDELPWVGMWGYDGYVPHRGNGGIKICRGMLGDVRTTQENS